jgi:hypothetical protein
MTLLNKYIGVTKEHKIYLFVWLTVVFLTAVVNYSDGLYYTRFIGELNPLYVFLISGIIGFATLSKFLSKNRFSIFKIEYGKRSFRYIWLIIPFTSIAIMVDYIMVFPEDMNIPFPDSLLFYPAMAFLVEIVFHVLPIATVLFLLTLIFKTIDKENVIWISIFIVALLEPTFQIFMDDYPIWALIITWMNLFLFNLTQLIVFKYYGFISMFLFRLFYYLIWHIIWGQFRLDLLFG